MVDQPKIDEVAQIVIIGPNVQPLILRYRTEKKAEKTYRAIQEIWSTGDLNVIEVAGDMFSSTVDLRQITHISLVVHKVRNKFAPIPM